MITYFKAPITNLLPYKDITLSQLYKAITGDYYKQKVEYLRSISDAKEYKEEKARILDYVTFSGTFFKRDANHIKQLSGLKCLDFDHIQNIEFLKRNLLRDQQLNIQMLFVSPGGDGLKVVVKDASTIESFSTDYQKLIDYCWKRFAAKADKTQNVARACFVSFDPKAYLGKEMQLDYLIDKNPNIQKMINTLKLEPCEK